MKETELLLKPSGFKTWELAQDFKVNTSQGAVIVPKEFETDLASIPRIFWTILPPFGRYSQAAVVHDYLYRYRIGTRKDADKVFKELMLRYGTYKWKTKVMYLAVRWFGLFAYHKQRGLIKLEKW